MSHIKYFALKSFSLTAKKQIFGLIFGLGVVFSCSNEQENTNTSPDFYTLPTYTENGILQAVIEIPAGTYQKIEYHPKTKEFQVDSLDGKARVLDFLAYPGNYGFIPSTFSGHEKEGDGDALDVLVIGGSVPTKTLQQIIPIGLLRLNDAGKLDHKIIAVPYQNSERTIKASSFKELALDYPAIRRIIGIWFKNYDPEDKITILGWSGEAAALEEIEKRRQKE